MPKRVDLNKMDVNTGQDSCHDDYQKDSCVHQTNEAVLFFSFYADVKNVTTGHRAGSLKNR
jgi:hypothetical protein